MAERPILFSAPMVRAILAGTKSQTRRAAIKSSMPGRVVACDFDSTECLLELENTFNGQRTWKPCPYGKPGDQLWVRETFYCDHCFYPHGTPPSCYWDGGKPRTEHTPEQLAKERADMLEAMYYRADGDPQFEGAEGPTPWRPSIYMPRWASRITLEITGVRVERLQDISEADAIAEGQRHGGKESCAPWGFDGVPSSFCDCPVTAYAALWESINGAGSWEANPWVWVVAFRRLDQ